MEKEQSIDAMLRKYPDTLIIDGNSIDYEQIEKSFRMSDFANFQAGAWSSTFHNDSNEEWLYKVVGVATNLQGNTRLTRTIYYVQKDIKSGRLVLHESATLTKGPKIAGFSSGSTSSEKTYLYNINRNNLTSSASLMRYESSSGMPGPERLMAANDFEKFARAYIKAKEN